MGRYWDRSRGGAVLDLGPHQWADPGPIQGQNQGSIQRWSQGRLLGGPAMGPIQGLIQDRFREPYVPEEFDSNFKTVKHAKYEVRCVWSAISGGGE